MTRPALPTSVFVLVDAENNATVSFNEWEGWVDGQVETLAIGVGKRAVLPPGVIMLAARATLPYAQWLGYVDRSAATFGTPTKRAPLPPSNLPLIGVDRKATLSFFMWLTYVDGLLG